MQRAAHTQTRRTLVTMRSGAVAASRSSASASLSVSRMQRVAAPVHLTPVRHLNLHEYQSKALMAKYNVRVQKGMVASTPDEAEQVARKLLKDNPNAELVIKAQVHAGGRGKGHFTNGFKGGVKITKDPLAIKEYAAKMIGSSLITAQTGPEGQPCKQVRAQSDTLFVFATHNDHRAHAIDVSVRNHLALCLLPLRSLFDEH